MLWPKKPPGGHPNDSSRLVFNSHPSDKVRENCKNITCKIFPFWQKKMPTGRMGELKNAS